MVRQFPEILIYVYLYIDMYIYARKFVAYLKDALAGNKSEYNIYIWYIYVFKLVFYGCSET